MANSFYNNGKGHLWSDINLLTDNIHAAFVDGDTYTPDLDEDEFLSDIGGSMVGSSAAITGKTIEVDEVNDESVFDAADTNVPGVSGATAELIVIFKDTGNAATSPLIAVIDTAQGLVLTPNGNDVLIRWPATGIFRY